MPIITIRDSNAQPPLEFFYQDSGTPNREVYTTLAVLHGIFFHSAAFKHVMPLATSKGFRMVCLNRRDYPGTTSYSPAELQALPEGDADEHAAFLKARGEEIAYFLDALIDALSIPGLTNNGKEGGLALMGWSMSSIFALSTTSIISSLKPQVQKRLQSYLRKLIIFDSPSQAFGIPSDMPSIDQTIDPQEGWARWAQWVSCYFEHGDLSTRKFGNIKFIEPNIKKQSVAASLSRQELNSLIDFHAASRSDMFLFRYQTVLYNQMYKAIFDLNTRSLWPKMDIWLIYCDSSAGMMINGAWEIEKLAKMNEDQPIRFLTIENVHHLVFWDDPEKAIHAFDYCLRS